MIDAQLHDEPEEEIQRLQASLNRLYDDYQRRHGLINSRAVSLCFRDDDGYFLLCSLEVLDDKGNFKGKSDIFTKRTIRPNRIPARAETASDAFALSIGERARVDMPYMMELTGKDEQTLVRELTGVIFVEPFQTQEDGSPVYLAADEYLSGDVRQKLRTARVAAEQGPAFRVNVQALEQVQPKDLTASEISVRLGATWIEPEIIKEFADELFSAKQKAQIILRVLSSIFATQMVRIVRRSFGFWRVGPHLRASENGERQMQAARGLQPNERASFAGWRALCPPSGTQGINRELCGIALSIPLFGNRINRFPVIL